MTKTKLVGGIMVMVLMLSGSTAIAATNEQVYAKSNAPIATEALSKPVVNKARAEVRPEPICKNWLVKSLAKAGFKGRGLRIAWAIAMRESGGAATHISSTGDYGVFQFNRAAWSKQPWWNTAKLLTRDYNIMIAYQISQHGKTFYPWDIDGAGRYKGLYTPKSVYKKYKSWYKKFPSNCN